MRTFLSNPTIYKPYVAIDVYHICKRREFVKRKFTLKLCSIIELNFNENQYTDRFLKTD